MVSKLIARVIPENIHTLATTGGIHEQFNPPPPPTLP